MAQSGDLNAIAKLSNLYISGDKLEKNYAEALKYTLQKGLEMDKWDMNRIGYIYENGGYGVSKDFKKAEEWYLKAYDYGYDVRPMLSRIGAVMPKKLSADEEYARRLAKASKEPNPSNFRGIAMEIYVQDLKKEGATMPVIQQKVKEKLLQMVDVDFYGVYQSIMKADVIPARELVVIFTSEQQSVIKDIANSQVSKTGYPASAPAPGKPWVAKPSQPTQNAIANQPTRGKEEFDKGNHFYAQNNFKDALYWYEKSAEKGQPRPCTIWERCI